MELVSTYPVKKSDLGFHGNLFGGELMKWIDGAAAAYAMQVCDTPRIVTVCIDKCEFKRPAKEGQLIKIYAKVERIGNTSIALYMEARSHSVYSGTQKVILSTSITFVRIDEEGSPIPIAERVRQRFESVDI